MSNSVLTVEYFCPSCKIEIATFCTTASILGHISARTGNRWIRLLFSFDEDFLVVLSANAEGVETLLRSVFSLLSVSHVKV